MIDSICIWLAWNVIPDRLVYWCAIRLGVASTVGRWSGDEVPSISMLTALARWNVSRSRSGNSMTDMAGIKDEK